MGHDRASLGQIHQQQSYQRFTEINVVGSLPKETWHHHALIKLESTYTKRPLQSV
jgi:hypothetical protein